MNPEAKENGGVFPEECAKDPESLFRELYDSLEVKTGIGESIMAIKNAFEDYQVVKFTISPDTKMFVSLKPHLSIEQEYGLESGESVKGYFQKMRHGCAMFFVYSDCFPKGLAPYLPTLGEEHIKYTIQMKIWSTLGLDFKLM